MKRNRKFMRVVVQELGFAFAVGHVRGKLPTLRDFRHDLRLEQLSKVLLDVHEVELCRFGVE